MSEYLKIYKLKLNGVVLLASCSSKAVPRGCMLHPRLGCCCPVHHVHGSGVMISCHHCMVTPIEGCHSAAYGWGLLHFSCIFHFVASMMPPRIQTRGFRLPIGQPMPGHSWPATAAAARPVALCHASGLAGGLGQTWAAQKKCDFATYTTGMVDAPMLGVIPKMVTTEVDANHIRWLEQ